MRILFGAPIRQKAAVLKEFLIDPEKPDDIYSNITVRKANNDD